MHHEHGGLAFRWFTSLARDSVQLVNIVILRDDCVRLRSVTVLLNCLHEVSVILVVCQSLASH